MKATILSSSHPSKPEGCDFKWYLVEHTHDSDKMYALPSPYGVIYVSVDEGHVTYSDRKFFNDKYTVIREEPSLTLSFKKD